MELPLKDTPALQLIERGLGDPETDASAVADCMQLLRVSKRLLTHFLEQFTADGISPGKYSVMTELLAAGEPVSPSWLAERIGVRRPTITGLLDGLDRQGFVARTFDEQDRRRVSVALTAQGRRFIRGLLPGQFERMAEVVRVLEPEERQRLRRILDKLEQGLT
ncbi:MAG: MarR family transcriptional regulator [Pseudomonadales bacterium]